MQVIINLSVSMTHLILFFYFFRLVLIGKPFPFHKFLDIPLCSQIKKRGSLVMYLVMHIQRQVICVVLLHSRSNLLSCASMEYWETCSEEHKGEMPEERHV